MLVAARMCGDDETSLWSVIRAKVILEVDISTHCETIRLKKAPHIGGTCCIPAQCESPPWDINPLSAIVALWQPVIVCFNFLSTGRVKSF